MLNPKQRAKIQKAINAYVKASVEYSWIGSKRPSEFDVIEADYRHTKQLLKQILESLTVENGQ